MTKKEKYLEFYAEEDFHDFLFQFYFQSMSIMHAFREEHFKKFK
jgi:hypothetical protein